MTKRRTDAALDGILVVVAVLVLGSAVMLVVALPRIFDTSSNTDAVLQGNEMAACRSLLAYDVNTAKAELDILFAEGLNAAVADDDATVADLAAQIPERAAAVRSALSAQRDGNTLSRDEPEQFLQQCEERG